MSWEDKLGNLIKDLMHSEQSLQDRFMAYISYFSHIKEESK